MNFWNRLALTLTIFWAAGAIPGVCSDSGPWTSRVSLEGGAAFPTPVNNFSDDARTGLLGGAQYLYNLDYFTPVGVQVDDYQFGSKTRTLSSAAGGQLSANSQATMAAFEIIGRYTFLPTARFMPYIHSGLGANVFHQTTDGTPAAGGVWFDSIPPGNPLGGTSETRRLPDVNSVGISFSFGAGVETNMTERLVLGLETTWRILGVSKAAYGNTAISVPSLAVRVGWRFGGEPLPPGS